MNKLKIISILITLMLVSVTIASIGGAEQLDGNIEVEIARASGVVNTNLNITNNQSTTIKVTVKGDGENTTYHVNDTLVIDLNITSNTGRQMPFTFPRSIIYGYIVSRSIYDFSLLGQKVKLFPSLKLFGSVNVADSLLGGEQENKIIINLNYTISNTTFEDGENLTINLFVMGIFPGEVTGSSHGAFPIPLLVFIGREVINLEVSYLEVD